MRKRVVLLTILVFAAMAVPGSAQGVGNGCDISGTWYGGSDSSYQYLASFTPVGAGR